MKFRFPTRIILVLSLIFVTGCKQGKELPPIDENKMAGILLDIHLAESYSQGLGDSMKNKFEKNYDTLPSFYTSILKHHNISFKDFNDAMEWYKERPVDIDTLYGKVINKLNELKAEKGINDLKEDKKEEVAQRTADSLRQKSNPLDTAKKSADSLRKKSNLQPKPTIQEEP